MTKKSAICIMFCILGLTLFYHLLILTEQIPYDNVWAGRLNSVEEMRSFETISILITVFILSILMLKYRLIQLDKKNKMIDALIYGFSVLFALNTFGNLFSQNMLELILGTLFTAISSVLCFIIARYRNKQAA